MNDYERRKEDLKALFKVLTGAFECRCGRVPSDAIPDDQWWVRMAKLTGELTTPPQAQQTLNGHTREALKEELLALLGDSERFDREIDSLKQDMLKLEDRTEQALSALEELDKHVHLNAIEQSEINATVIQQLDTMLQARSRAAKIKNELGLVNRKLKD